MNIQEFTELLFAGHDGTFDVNLDGGEWVISQVAFSDGFQVGVGNLGLVTLSRDGEQISFELLQEQVLTMVSDFYYTGLLDNPRQLGAWVESDDSGQATLWVDRSVRVADKLSANIVGAVLGEKEIYEWGTGKCHKVIPVGK
jgi:hypothetical protein